jgi:hypothetical protein
MLLHAAGRVRMAISKLSRKLSSASRASTEKKKKKQAKVARAKKAESSDSDSSNESINGNWSKDSLQEKICAAYYPI